MKYESNQEIKDKLSEYKRAHAMVLAMERQIKKSDQRSEITDLEARKKRFEKKADESRKRVESIIDTVLSPRHNNLLFLHFINLRSIEEIADQEGYSERHIWRLYREAVELIGKDC